MTAKHTISVAGAAIALGLFAGSASATASGWPTGRPIIVTDLSEPSTPFRGRGLDIAAIDGQIGP